MKIDKSLIKSLGFALSLPSTIFVAGILSVKLYEAEYISKLGAAILCTVIIGNSLFLMVYYSKKRK